MQTTKLSKESVLPLTCSRAGTCCYGKTIFINPWELYSFSKEKNISSKDFRDEYCEFGGIQLRFNGPRDKKGQAACSQYTEQAGCSVYNGRPLACRLYPLGRQIQFDEAHYIYQGAQFPCLADCAEVLELPKLSVGEYLKGQETTLFEKAQDEYLIVMQNIADVGFQLLLESELATSGDSTTLAIWRLAGNESHEDLTKRIGTEWMDYLMLPNIINEDDPILFAQKHKDSFIAKAQEKFGTTQSLKELHTASVLFISIALQLAKSLGADSKGISEHWIATAKSHGAKE